MGAGGYERAQRELGMSSREHWGGARAMRWSLVRPCDDRWTPSGRLSSRCTYPVPATRVSRDEIKLASLEQAATCKQSARTDANKRRRSEAIADKIRS